MTLRNTLDYINALRADADSPSGDDEAIMIDLIYLASIDLQTMLNFPFNLERKTITAAGGATEAMDSDFEDIVGGVQVGGISYPMLGTEQINEASSSARYVYMTFNTTTNLWTMNFNPTLTAGDSVVFTQRISMPKVTTVGSNLPFPNDICMFLVYDVAARLEWQEDEADKGEEIKQRRELLLKDLKKKYNMFSGKNNRYAQFDSYDGFGESVSSKFLNTTVS